MFSPLRGGANHRVPTNYSINFTEGKHDSEDKIAAIDHLSSLKIESRLKAARAAT